MASKFVFLRRFKIKAVASKFCANFFQFFDINDIK